MSDGKARKKQKYYILKQVAPTQQAVEMARDQIKVIKARKKGRKPQKHGAKVKKIVQTRKTKAQSKTKKKRLVLKKGLKPDFFS